VSVAVCASPARPPERTNMLLRVITDIFSSDSPGASVII
jgi:hypothetical protein